MLTTAASALDAGELPRASPRAPDHAVLQFGAWDRQLPRGPELVAQMEALLTKWAASSSTARATLTVAAPPRPWSGLDDARPPLAACLGGAWERHLLRLAPRAAFLNRVRTTDALRNASALVAACPCLAEFTYRNRARTRRGDVRFR